MERVGNWRVSNSISAGQVCEERSCGSWTEETCQPCKKLVCREILRSFQIPVQVLSRPWHTSHTDHLVLESSPETSNLVMLVWPCGAKDWNEAWHTLYIAKIYLVTLLGIRAHSWWGLLCVKDRYTHSHCVCTWRTELSFPLLSISLGLLQRLCLGSSEVPGNYAQVSFIFLSPSTQPISQKDHLIGCCTSPVPMEPELHKDGSSYMIFLNSWNLREHSTLDPQWLLHLGVQGDSVGRLEESS